MSDAALEMDAPVADATVTAPVDNGTAAAPKEPAPVAEKPTSLLATNDKPAADAAKDDAPYWRDDWRARLAGDDEKELKRLERIPDVETLYKSYRNLEKKLSSGEYRRKLGDDATPEEVARYRKEIGVPEKPDGYELPEGYVPSAEDKEFIGGFLEQMHGLNAPKEIVKSAIDTYRTALEEASMQRAESDLKAKQEGEDALREAWGGDYRVNLNAVGTLLDGLEGEAKEQFLGARLADGTPLASSASVLKFLAGVARDLNPIPSIVGAGVSTPQGMHERKAAIEAEMAKGNNGPYWKGPQAEAMQSEYNKILQAMEKRGEL